MDVYRELSDRLRRFGSNNAVLYQGIVKSVSGVTCSVAVGNLEIPEVRLKATETTNESHILITPKVGSGVIVGSLTGDMTQLVVLSVDCADKLSIDCADKITINGGKLGGFIKINELTKAINTLVDAFNQHTHTTPNGNTSTPMIPATKLKKENYEDTKIIH